MQNGNNRMEFSRVSVVEYESSMNMQRIVGNNNNNQLSNNINLNNSNSSSNNMISNNIQSTNALSVGRQSVDGLIQRNNGGNGINL